ncbi:TAXI family TRAP transporter solute-binding subunit [Bradyrhizobium sp.]|uniref:TAXI family TRAP transporter solute-binding subunit n=1 Tax=Bradyrhizobium sp. TaxID=376 RepID=UPI00271647AB|nr:TAXI family TRAP transporter solute-binding subunit [Bradyrhizobium sp.]MDO9299454.1 TAXI family TRAP transporter solute-binding subunit [Bradyrhizobium sp.]
MSAEIPTPRAAKPFTRSRLVKSNRRQMLLFAALTVILTVATVWGSRVWLNSETLVFAVGSANGPEARFAAKLAAMLKNANSRLHLKIVANPDSAKALAQFDRKQADLAILRTDAKVPSRARAVAILERDVVLLVSPAGKKIKSLAELKKRKVALVADADSGGATFIRKLLEVSDDPAFASRLQLAPPVTNFDKLLAPGGYGAVIAIAPVSRLLRDKSIEQQVRRGGLILNDISESKALVRRYPGLTEETLSAGMLSSTPAIPSEDLDTVGLQWLLVAQSRLSTAVAVNLARAIYENKGELALENGFASRIEPASTDKDAFIVAHQGATDYLNDDTKSFVDRYSDLAYLGVAVLGVIGSLFAALYTKVTRIAPEKASALATAILDIGERMEHATSMDALDALQDELETVLRGVVIGLRDGTISKDGLDTFKLGYEFVRDELALRRESLKRHAGHDDNVVIVKTAQSA